MKCQSFGLSSCCHEGPEIYLSAGLKFNTPIDFWVEFQDQRNKIVHDFPGF